MTLETFAKLCRNARQRTRADADKCSEESTIKKIAYLVTTSVIANFELAALDLLDEDLEDTEKGEKK